jgi:putative ABC transport system substrate-binding protein
LLTLVESFTLQQRSLIARLAIANRLPTLFEVKDYVEAGGLLSYGLPYRDHYAQAANYVVKIIRGAAPRDLPVEQPTKFELVINLKTAKALGLIIPPTLLARADEVIE